MASEASQPWLASLSTMARYFSQKLEFSINLCWTGYQVGYFTGRQAGSLFMKYLFNGDMSHMTYHWHLKIGEGMAPMISGSGSTLLIRKLCITGFNKRVFVGDVVAFTNPLKQNHILFRRVAATEGCEMVSNDKTDKPFVLPKNQLWVLADNENVKPEEANDSRTFGPIRMESIVGRAVYCIRSAEDHGIVQNSESGMHMDLPILEVELDIDEMIERHEEAESAETKNGDS